MLYALDENKTKIKATPDTRAECPCCFHEVMSKCGDVKVWHWAHISDPCDIHKESETEWHLNWKGLFPAKWAEVRVKGGDNYRIADIKTDYQMVIEFQHSPIAWEEMRSRERFYPYMVWVFDAREAWEAGRIKSSGGKVYWEHPRYNFMSRDCRVFLDLNPETLFEPFEGKVMANDRDIRTMEMIGEFYRQDEVVKAWHEPPDDLVVCCDYKKNPRFVSYPACQWHRKRVDPECAKCEQYLYPFKPTEGIYEIHN